MEGGYVIDCKVGQSSGEPQLSFTPLTMLQACTQAVDFKVGHHFGEGQGRRFRNQVKRLSENSG
jgi:hypothetical protein